MNRKTMKQGFSGKGATGYTCPSCGKNLLSVVDGSFTRAETKESRAMHGFDAWGPEYVNYVFSCMLRCVGPNCAEVVACSGTGDVDEFYEIDEEGNPYPEWEDRFFPKIFNPSLKLFTIPSKTPEDATQALTDSFAVVFLNPASAANHIRVSLERFLTHLKVKRFTINKKNKRQALSLHARIDAIPARYEHVKDLCFALKWIGNAGSHASADVSIDDVLDVYDIYEELLREIFSGKSKNAKDLAKLINKKKGPK